MRNWLICLPRADMEHCIKLGKFGLNRKHIMGGINEGDGVVCCASKDWKILAVGRATSEYYLDTSKVFLKEGLFPDRFDFHAEQVAKEREIDVKQILEQLSFVTNLAYWAVFFKNAIVEISQADYEFVAKKLS